MKKWIEIISIIGCLIIIGIVMPYGLKQEPDIDALILECETNPDTTCFIDDYSDSKYIIFILGIILPIVVVVAFLIYYLPPKEKENDLNNG